MDSALSEPEFLKPANAENGAAVREGRQPESSMGVVARDGVEQRFLGYFGLIEQPFGVTPDLRFLYLGSKHRKALDILNYGTELNRGFLTLIAPPGMGKTSLLFQYLENLRDKARTVFLFQTDCDSTELMRYLLVELGLDGKGMDLAEMRAILGQVLLGEMEAGRRFVLVFDEAQNLDEKVLESVRLLSNFETPWMKLMHIVLAGQPQLADRLAKPSMAQLRQRISFAVRLEPFTREEVDFYINHRLWVAGYKGAPLFSVGARALIAEGSEGIPRNINNICFCAMSYAWAMKMKTVDRDTMAAVLNDLYPGSPVEREFPAPKLPETPKPAVSKSIRPAAQTLSPPTRRSGPAKFVAAGLMAFALGWFGLQYHVDKWIGSYFHHFSEMVRSYAAPAASSVGPNDPSTAAHIDESTSPKSAPLTDEKDLKTPMQDGGDASPSGAGHN